MGDGRGRANGARCGTLGGETGGVGQAAFTIVLRAFVSGAGLAEKRAPSLPGRAGIPFSMAVAPRSGLGPAGENVCLWGGVKYFLHQFALIVELLVAK